MGFFTNAQKPSRSSLLVMMTSGSVELSVVIHEEGKRPRIVFDTIRAFDASIDDVKTLFARGMEALKDARDDLIEEGLPHIVSRKIHTGHFDAIQCIYGAPWYVSRGRTVIIEKKNPTIFSERLLEELRITHTKNLLPPELGETAQIESFAHDYTIDGYPIEDPIGKSGKELGMKVFVSAIGTTTRESVTKILEDHLHTKTITHHALPLAVVTTLTSTVATDATYALVEISRHMTEITLVSNGIVLDTISYPYGDKNVRKDIAESLHVLPHEAETRAQDPSHFIDVPTNIPVPSETPKMWEKLFRDSLATVTSGREAPTSCVLLSDPILRRFYGRAIENVLPPQQQAGVQTVHTLTETTYESGYLHTSHVRPKTPILGLMAVWDGVVSR